MLRRLAVSSRSTSFQRRQPSRPACFASDFMPMKHQLTALIDAIAQEEARLARLDAERTGILERLGELRERLSVIEAESTPPPKHSTLSSIEKIALFRSLFRG